jgi:glycosyltransferase involved in cell wall biosynthesis
MSTPRTISVVITNYNYGAFVGDAIRSVLAQTYPHVECVVVDDGSTDQSWEVISSFEGIVKIQQRNQRQAVALRTGIEAASGDVVIGLDSDDFLYPHACETIARHWQDGTSLTLYELDHYAGNRKLGGSYPNQPFLDGGHLAFVARYGYFPSAPLSGNAFSRSYVRELYEEAINLDRGGVDAYLLYSAPAVGMIVTIREKLGGYRFHDTNVSMASGKSLRNLSNYVYQQYWAQQTAQKMMKKHGVAFTPTTMPLGPYVLRWHLMTRALQGDKTGLPSDLPYWPMLLACIRAFLTYPNIGLGSRVKNVSFTILYALLPVSLQRRVFGVFYRS